jgi:hypothetical protein
VGHVRRGLVYQYGGDGWCRLVVDHADRSLSGH